MNFKQSMLFSALLFVGLAIVTSHPRIAEAGGRSISIRDPNLGHEIFTKALNEKNLDVLVDIYADDAVMVAAGGNVIRGKPAIRKFFADTIKVVDGIELSTVFRMNYKDTVVFRSKYKVVFRTPDGKTITRETSGIEVIRRQDDGSWLFIADHHYGGADYQDFLKLNHPQK